KSLPLILPVYAYIGYLVLDHFLIPQRRLVKWLRTASPVLFAMGYSETVLRAFERPPLPAGEALAALTLGALFPYLYEHGQTVLGFVRGLVFAIYLELLVQFIAPLAPGPHLALPLFAAVFAWERRTVFWRYTTPVLLLYCVLLVREVGPSAGQLIPHATA